MGAGAIREAFRIGEGHRRNTICCQGWALLKYFVLKYMYLSTFSVLKYLRKYIFQPVLKYST